MRQAERPELAAQRRVGAARALIEWRAAPGRFAGERRGGPWPELELDLDPELDCNLDLELD
jgi:hypothetical protein